MSVPNCIVGTFGAVLAKGRPQKDSRLGWTNLVESGIVRPRMFGIWPSHVHHCWKVIMDVSPTYLRFFLASCSFGIAIGVMGCATNNWSQPLFRNQQVQVDSQFESETTSGAAEGEKNAAIIPPKSFWKQGFGEMSGTDPRAREIERSLGF